MRAARAVRSVFHASCCLKLCDFHGTKMLPARFLFRSARARTSEIINAYFPPFCTRQLRVPVGFPWVPGPLQDFNVRDKNTCANLPPYAFIN